MLELKNITITQLQNDRDIVKNIDLVVNQGDKVVIIGEEGNGKSTLLKLIYDSATIEDYCS